MASPDHLRKRAEAFLTLAKASSTEGVGLVYAMHALECLSEADAAEPEHSPDAIEMRILGDPDKDL
jgi:hypothetical protein